MPAAQPDPTDFRSAPLDLPRLVMRRALWVAFGALALAVAIGLAGARYDTGQEIAGALRLAQANQLLATLATVDDTTALGRLRELGGLRHVQLQILGDPRDGTPLLLQSADAPPPGPLVAALLKLNGQFGSEARQDGVSWPLQRPGGRTWTVAFTGTPQSEQREAMQNLVALFGLLAGCCALMLVVMQVNVRRAFSPLQPMLRAIALVEQQDLRPLQALPAMPIRELDAIAAALRHLAVSLQQAEDARRLLGHKVQTLQEDERQRLARDLHDEFGQRLTALRVDAAWLRRRVADVPELLAVVAGMEAHCERIQKDVRHLLARLQPLDGDSTSAPRESLGRLRELLDDLVSGWSGRAAALDGQVAAPSLQMRIGEAATARDATPQELERLMLPRDVVLAVFRITQEAMTNIARHAVASSAKVEVRIETSGNGETRTLDWQVEDDGRGIADLAAAFQQGNGLAGIKERIWAVGGELDAGPTRETAPRGLRLHARLPCRPTEIEDSAEGSA